MENRSIFKRILDYLIKTLNGMALGLFSTLIIGVIFSQIGTLLHWEAFTELGTLLKSLMGIGIGIGVTASLNRKGLYLISGAVAGGIATLIYNDPMVAYISTILTNELVSLILRKKTPLDILLIPLISGIIAYFSTVWFGYYIAWFMKFFGSRIDYWTELQPFVMGIIIAVIMGMALTAPISSAAIAIAISLEGIAGGAAVVGCCVQMLGFAVMSRKDNNIGEVISIGIGTSMLQFKNILRKPIIWLPTIIVSAILGPLSTLVFKTQTTKVGSGMGTSGLVGQFGTLDAMGYNLNAFLNILILQIALPILLVYVIDLFFRKRGWIVKGDLSLKNNQAR